MDANSDFIENAKRNYATLQQETSQLYKKHFIEIPLGAGDNTDATSSSDLERMEKRISANTGIEFDLVVGGDIAFVRNNSNVRISTWKDAADDMADHKMHGNEEDKFAAFMNAYADSAVFVEAKKDEIANVNILQVSGAANSLNQIFINAENGSNLRIQEVHAGGDPKNVVLSGTMREIRIAEGATVELDSVHDENGKTITLAFCKAFARDGGTFHFNAMYGGGSHTRVRNVLEAQGYKSRVSATEMVFGGDTQRFDLSSSVVNNGVETSATLDSRAALEGKAVCMLKGLAKLVKGSRGARSYVHERGMLLDANAHIESMPDMSVDENDVKATHSSATAPVDPETVFYLESRGINAEEVKKLVVAGFFTGSLSKVTNDTMRTLVMATVNNRLSGVKGRLEHTVSSRGLWSAPLEGSTDDMFKGHYKYR